ncbi:MAG: hypothetical protein KGY48_01930 [Wenzhouxiangellaceae bacterium]|nr:hypothetical protein [Wenzhouxiangellaceae bacterium]
MNILSFAALHPQARPRRNLRLKPGVTTLARELAGLTGLLAWLVTLFYLTALGTARFM